MTSEELLQDYWYMSNERHRIFISKEKGLPKPWTEDRIFQQYKFTNVFRELDRTTIFVKENIRAPLVNQSELLLFNVALFRQTGAAEGWQGIVKKFDVELIGKRYTDAQDRGVKIFTGAYMVTGQFPGSKNKPKILSLLEYALKPVWENRKSIVKNCLENRSLQSLTEELGRFSGWKGNNFMAYEVACDLLYTELLRGAVDQFTWANPGPGAQRGLCRLFGGDLNMARGGKSRPKEKCIEEMQYLLSISKKYLDKHITKDKHENCEVDMRFIENSLCEFDKRRRTIEGQGRPRSKYEGI